MYASNILKVFQCLDSQDATTVRFSCDSIAMRSVKVSTVLFSEEEPIIAHKMTLMEKSISDLAASQKIMLALFNE